MSTRVFALLFAMTLALAAQSQPPTPRGREVAQQQQEKPANQQREAQTEIPVTGGLSAAASVNTSQPQPQTPAPREDAGQQGPPAPIDYTDWIIAGATVGLFIVALFQLLTFRRQATTLERQATILDTQAKTYDATLAANKTVERAYVSMSHQQPGIVPVPPNAIDATVGINNGGHTPADILEMRWNLALTEAEVRAERSRQPPPLGAPVVASLLPNDTIYYSQRLPVDPSTLTQILAGAHPLWVVGSVTYLDRLDRRRHRHWYGRQYLHQPGSPNNLVFMFEDHPDFAQEDDLD